MPADVKDGRGSASASRGFRLRGARAAPLLAVRFSASLTGPSRHCSANPARETVARGRTSLIPPGGLLARGDDLPGAPAHGGTVLARGTTPGPPHGGLPPPISPGPFPPGLISSWVPS